MLNPLIKNVQTKVSVLYVFIYFILNLNLASVFLQIVIDYHIIIISINENNNAYNNNNNYYYYYYNNTHYLL